MPVYVSTLVFIAAVLFTGALTRAGSRMMPRHAWKCLMFDMHMQLNTCGAGMTKQGKDVNTIMALPPIAECFLLNARRQYGVEDRWWKLTHVGTQKGPSPTWMYDVCAA